MARTKQEVRNWLESQVNKTLSDPQGEWTGECVTLIKCLMDFLGVPNPYAARGHAKDAANTYLVQGIADNGKGWLTICVNSTWGSGYGHIWADLQNEHSYEQNGKVYHVVTKDTKKISSATQWVNFDKWIKEEEVTELQPPVFNEAYYLAANPDVAKAGYRAIDHWQAFGIKEGRASAPNFHVQEYLANYPDLQQAYGTNWLGGIYHYYQFGINEGRFGTKALFDAAKESSTLQSEVASLKTKLDEAKAQYSGSFTEADRAMAQETNNFIKKIAEWFKAIFKVS